MAGRTTNGVTSALLLTTMLASFNPSMGQEATPQSAETRRALNEINEIRGKLGLPPRGTESTAFVAPPDTDDLEKRVAQLKEDAKKAAEAAPKPFQLPPVIELIPPADGPEDGLTRLRNNQRALTDQRIGDILILKD